MPIKAVLFDLDDTLWDRGEQVRRVVIGQYDAFKHELCSVQNDDFVRRVLQLDDHGYERERRAALESVETHVNAILRGEPCPLKVCTAGANVKTDSAA